MEKLEKITELIFKHLTNDLTPTERNELDSWVNSSNENKAFFEEAGDVRKLLKALERNDKFTAGVDIEKAWSKLDELGLPQALKTRTVFNIGWKRLVAAASILLIIATSIYLLNKPEESNKPVGETPQLAIHEAKPKSRVATLTLDNGKTIYLDSAQQGIIATEGNVKVTKHADGTISYGNVDDAGTQKILYNTVNIPKGSDVVYLKLSDGSSVWLNAASSIRYPVSFTGSQREIEITGEAYFEVAPSISSEGGRIKRPFIVNVEGVKVEVLGTHFNINAYNEEGAVRTTLIEGSVIVHQANLNKIIKPGEQAITQSSGKMVVTHDIDIEQVMAWKNGLFVFQNTNMQVIMRQIERWYDVETVYEDEVIKTMEFAGEMSRYNNASKVLTFLEQASAGSFKFKIEGKKVILYQ